MNITSIKLTNRQTNENCFGVSQNILLQYFTNPEILLYQRHRRNLQKVARRTGCYGTEMLHFWDKFTTQDNVFFIRAFCLSSHRRWVTWNNKLKPFLIEEKNRITAYLGSIEFCSSLRIVLIDSMWYIPMNTSMWYIPMDTFNVIYIPMNTSSVLHVCPFG